MLVLIVEDDPLIALDLEGIILDYSGADIIIGRTIKGAEPLLDRPLDFAFLDVDLADGKTYELASALQRKNVPFAFVSGSRRQDMPANLQCAPFVAKPYSPADIAGAIRPSHKQAA